MPPARRPTSAAHRGANDTPAGVHTTNREYPGPPTAKRSASTCSTVSGKPEPPRQGEEAHEANAGAEVAQETLGAKAAALPTPPPSDPPSQHGKPSFHSSPPEST